jgi:hypothetical protein
MSTEEDLEGQKEKPIISDFARLLDEVRPASADVALDEAQKQLQDERDARRGERFYWICSVILIVDTFMFKDMQTWSGPISLSVLEFIIIIALGRSLGNDQIWTLTEKIIGKWDGHLQAR